MLHFPISLLIFSFCWMISFSGLKAQTNIPVTQRGPTPDWYSSLSAPRDSIRHDHILNEHLVDLADCFVTDSIVRRKRQHHRVGKPGSWMFMVMGYYWEAIQRKKVKLVGTGKGGIRVPGKELFLEYDVNIDVIPHLAPYIGYMHKGYQFEKMMSRNLSEERKSRPPFVFPNDSTLDKHYRMHLECTPFIPQRQALDERFIPCVRPSEGFPGHPAWGENKPTLGVYGTLAADCNHHCHPEIHPYEWIWWLDLNPNKPEVPNSRAWYIGYLRDASKRLKGWVRPPRTGEFSVPFTFPANASKGAINMEILTYDAFTPKGMTEMKNRIPDGAFALEKGTTKILFEFGEGRNLPVSLNTTEGLPAAGFQYWFSNLNYDPGQGLISGKLHFALSVENVFTTRIAFSHE